MPTVKPSVSKRARDVRRARTAASVPHTQTCSRNLVLYLVATLAPIMIILRIDDAILCIIDNVTIVLYGIQILT